MDAAHPPNAASARSAARVLDHCAAVDPRTVVERHNARAQLESELGGELAGLLYRALVTRRPRARSLTVV